jgi:FkbM family methyltransferase
VGGVDDIDVRKLLRHPDPSQLLYQIQEIVEERIYLQHGVHVAEGDVVFDVGANVGVSAAFFAANCGAFVHSFEPVRPIYEILRENVRRFPKCSAHNLGLSSHARRAAITYYPNADAMSGLYADPEADRAFARTCMQNLGIPMEDAERSLEGRYDNSVNLTCELRTLSSMLRELEVDLVHLLKVDVERAELDVLEGIDQADWPAIDQVVAEVHDENGHLAAVKSLLMRQGFKTTVEQQRAMRTTDLHIVYATRG